MCLILDLVYANYPVALLVHIFPQTNDYVLGCGLLLDECCQEGGILVIQSCVNFVHEVERKFLDLLTCENQSQRSKGLLASREQVDSFPRFVDRPNRKLNPFERIHSIDKVKLCFSTRQFSVNSVQLYINIIEMTHENIESLLSKRNKPVFD